MWARIMLLSFIAAGCTGGDGDPMDDGIQDDTEVGVGDGTEMGDDEDTVEDAAVPLGPLQAVLAGKLLAFGIEETAKRYGPILPNAGAAPDCVTLSGDTSDADGDYIPASAKLTLDCSTSKLGYTGTLTGVESVTDHQPNTLAWAFRADADLHSVLTGPLGGSMVIDGSGAITASQQSALGPYDLSAQLGVDSVITNLRGIETRVFEDIDWTVSFAPEVEWTPGGLAPAGSLSVAGSWLVSVNDRWAEATLETPTALSFSPSCDTLINGGVVIASLTTAGQSGSIRVAWPRCGQRRVSYEIE